MSSLHVLTMMTVTECMPVAGSLRKYQMRCTCDIWGKDSKEVGREKSSPITFKFGKCGVIKEISTPKKNVACVYIFGICVYMCS